MKGYFCLNLPEENVSKKQIRINAPATVNDQVQKLINKQVNLVLQDGTTILGMLVQAENDQLILSNMRLKKIKVPLKKVMEIFTDIDP